MSKQLTPNPYDDIKIKIAQQRLSQANLSFRLAVTIHIICFIISLGGWDLLISGKVSEGTITAATGLVSSVEFLKFAKSARDSLDRILAELDE
ncbi:MAG: hypothetical protein AB4372_20200 [Xenococcus sp. (in: cyanobacteria)]